MVDFLKFMLKCLWQGLSYVFSTGSAGTKTQAPFDVLGIIGFCVLAISFLLFGWFVVKLDSLSLRIIISLLISLVIVVAYFLIAYFFVR